MLPSRYMLIDERSPYPVKRRVRSRRDEKHEPAITLLPPDPYLIMEKPSFDRLPSPTMYRTAPPKSAKNKEASSFVILGETIHSPVQSRPGSPSGRVSPFRGHGFKSPNATRPNSRAASPSNSPRKNLPKVSRDKPRISKDIGLPPKSPKSKKPKPLVLAQPETGETEKSEKADKETKAEDDIETQDPEPPKDVNESEVKKKPEVLEEPKPESVKKETETESKGTLKSSKKPPVSPTPKSKPKPEKMEEKSVMKKAAKPPIPPKKVGMKATLKSEESVKQTELTKVKEASQPVKLKEVIKPPKTVEVTQKKEKEKREEKGEKKKEEEKEEKKKEGKKEEEKKGPKKEEEKKEENKQEEKREPNKEEEKEVKKPEERKEDEKKGQKLIPCFQPDKCQIAPPTMASPSPIMTPSISTPSTSADLASSSMKNSQSISAAPTTVTPSSFSSVSSTVVLSGNLARKEIEHRVKETEAKTESRESVAPPKEPEPPPVPPKASVQMLKAQSKDSVSWSKKDNLSGEITSTTKVIKAEPDMEVLSPNNLRDSPPRALPANVAWEEDRLPNGDVPNKEETEGKFRRFISAAWKFLSYLIYCRCFKRFDCCRKQQSEGGPPAPPKPSWFSRLNCFKGRPCPNPFRACFARCRSGCCDKIKCCRVKSKPKLDPKPRKCCAKSKCCSLKGCCGRLKDQCSDCRDKVNNCCRSLFCLNLMCCQKFLRKFKFFHKFKCCQKDGCCSCCNPNVKKDARKLNKKGSRGSNNSRDKDNLDLVLVEHTSLMKAAIPVLPSCLAVFCLICNLFVPGFGSASLLRAPLGVLNVHPDLSEQKYYAEQNLRVYLQVRGLSTFISGMFCLCFGKPRFSVKDTPKNRLGSFIVNTVIAIAQLFTVVFCLVGWGWSIWWGVIMYKLSRRQKRLKLAEKNQKEAEGSNVNHNHVDVEQG